MMSASANIRFTSWWMPFQILAFAMFLVPGCDQAPLEWKKLTSTQDQAEQDAPQLANNSKIATASESPALSNPAAPATAVLPTPQPAISAEDADLQIAPPATTEESKQLTPPQVWEWFQTLSSYEISDKELAALVDVAPLLTPPVRSLKLTRSSISDDGLQVLCKITSLQELDLSFCPRVTNAGVRLLSPLNQLEKLNICSTAIAHQALTALSNFTSLKMLNVSGTKIASDDFTAFRQLVSLEELYLNDTAITGVGIDDISPHAPLRVLDVSATQLNVQGLKAIIKRKTLQKVYARGSGVNDTLALAFVRMSPLEELDLSDNPITDLGVKSLAKLPNIKSLFLNQTQVSDQTLKSLNKSKKLTWLEVRGTQVTQQGITEFLKHLPKATVKWE